MFRLKPTHIITEGPQCSCRVDVGGLWRHKCQSLLVAVAGKPTAMSNRFANADTIYATVLLIQIRLWSFRWVLENCTVLEPQGRWHMLSYTHKSLV